MIRLLFILLLALAPVQAFAEEDVAAPPASLKSPEIAPAKNPVADQAPEPEPVEPAEDSAEPEPENPPAAPDSAEPAPPAEDKAEEPAKEEAKEEKAGAMPLPPVEEDEATEEVAEEPAAEPEAATEEAVAEPEKPAAPAAPRRWNMVPGESVIGFSGSQMGKDFAGVIEKFTADIVFDEANLAQSKVTVDIDLLSLDAKDEERNKTVKGDEWLDVEKFPAARFETKSISKTGDGGYVADATLKIHGVSQEIKLPFALAFSKAEKGPDKGKDRAVMTGKVVLDRSNFQLGQGEWEDPSIIANEIAVEVKVTAIAAPPAADKAPPATP